MKLKIFVTTIFVILILSIGIEINAQIRVGAILPLMESSEDAGEKVLGEEIRKGITDALNEYNASDSVNNIILKVEDSNRDPQRVLDIINEMGSNKNIIAIIGPVFSSEISNNAGAPAFHKIPLITPTATENYLAENNEYLFQLNPTYEVRGKLMGKYATKELNMKNFMILSEESYGIKYARAFTDEVLNSGGNVLVTKYFTVEETDMDTVIGKVKSEMLLKEKFLDFGNLNPDQVEKLERMNFVFSNVDSLISTNSIVSIYKIFGYRAERIVDSAKIIPMSITFPDKSRNYIYGLIDAIYIPVSNPEKVNLILPALRRSGLDLPVIGTSDWNNQKILEDNSDNVKRLYFETDYYIKDNPLGNTEKKNYYMGYDAMMLVAKKISEGNNTRSKLNDALQKVDDFKAVHINFTIKSRTNYQMMVMKFENGNLEMLGEYTY